jgi:hypothetical protein
MTDHARTCSSTPPSPTGNRRPTSCWWRTKAAGDGLAVLLGPTRAVVLRALAAPRGTVELAGVVGVSLASASEHAKVLRDANLIETSREGRAGATRWPRSAARSSVSGPPGAPGPDNWSR